jgi:hypothetical protein
MIDTMADRDESNGNGSSYAIGALTREIAGVRHEMQQFHEEVRSSFKQLGVRLKKRVEKTERKMQDLEEEIEDTKTHDLRMFKRRYLWWKNTALSGIGLVLTGVITALIAKYVFHVG